MPRANSFVKSELQEALVAYTPADDIYNVVDPCTRCLNSRSGKTSKPWEYCMLQRRHCLRRNEEHPLPSIRRVHVNDLSEERDFACVFENDGGDTIKWDKRTTRCRVPCDKCWSLAQCTRMHHTLDPRDIPFLDIDDAPGVTPAKRSCKSTNPLGHAKASGSGGRDAKQARKSPASSQATAPRADAGSSPPAPLTTLRPPPPSLPAMPAVAAAEAGPAAVTPRSSPSSSGRGRPSGGAGSGGGGNSGGSSLPGPAAPVPGGGDKGKRPARNQSGGAGAETGGTGVGNDLRSLSPDAAAGAGAGTGAGGAGAGGAGAGARVQLPAAGRGSDVYIEGLREQVQAAASEVQKAVQHLDDLDKVKLHAGAQIRDGERLLKKTKQNEQDVQKRVEEFKSKEAEAKSQLKMALKGEATKLKQLAGQMEWEAQQL